MHSGWQLGGAGAGDAPRRFLTLVPLERGEGTQFQVVGDPATLPRWIRPAYLRSPRAVHLESWLLQLLFGRKGEMIPHVESVTHTLLHVSHFHPGGDSEILIFGRPHFQKDVSKMIKRMAHHFRLNPVPGLDVAPIPEGDALPLWEVYEADILRAQL